MASMTGPNEQSRTNHLNQSKVMVVTAALVHHVETMVEELASVTGQM